LGRWLRIAGYDTAIAERGRRDRELVEQAHAEKRILLTCDRRLVEIRRRTTGRSSSNATESMPAPTNSPSVSPSTGTEIRSAVAPFATYCWNQPIIGCSIRCRRGSEGSAPR
jgi:hypothetical protein